MHEKSSLFVYQEEYWNQSYWLMKLLLIFILKQSARYKRLFKDHIKECTAITIAHTINTVLNCDKCILYIRVKLKDLELRKNCY